MVDRVGSNTCLIESNTRSIVAGMRWDALRDGPAASPGASPGAPQGTLFERGAVARTFDTPYVRLGV